MKLAATLTLTGALLTAITALADPYVMSKQQARRVSDQNAAEQQSIQQQTAAPAANPAAPAPSPPPMDPALAATLKNIGELRGDLAALISATNAGPLPTQKVSLLNNLTAAAQATKPAADSVKKLAEHLTTATIGKKIPAPLQIKLARYLHAVFNSSHLSAAQLQMILDDTQKILTSAETSPDDAGNVVADLKAIAAATK